MENLKVTSTAYPDGQVVTYDDGMEPVNPKNMSRVMVEAVKNELFETDLLNQAKELISA